jgi:hypothetical protein
MNERIKELIKQATSIEYGVDNGFDMVIFDKEKFAALIIIECIDIIPLDLPSTEYNKVMQAFEKHFGD